jgi:hypothetical protein
VRTRITAPARRDALLGAAAVVTLLLGYADLVVGGLTLGPVLLVASYLLLIPATLLRS